MNAWALAIGNVTKPMPEVRVYEGPTVRPCDYCGADITPAIHHPNQRFCSPPDGKRNSLCAGAYRNIFRRKT